MIGEAKGDVGEFPSSADDCGKTLSVKRKQSEGKMKELILLHRAKAICVLIAAAPGLTSCIARESSY